MRFALSASLVLAAGACGDTATPGRDADAVDADLDALDGTVGAPVTPPAAPIFTPCPAGWREVASGDWLECEPWPDGAPAACDPTSAHFLGSTGCARVGPPCPADGVPADLPSDVPIVHVRADATGGDGSTAAPFGSLHDGLAAAPPRAVVALAPGTYDARVDLRTPITIVGACTDVVLTAPGPSPAMAVLATAELRSLRFSGTADALVTNDSVVTIRDVVIEDAAEAVRAFGGTLDIERLVVRRTAGGGVAVGGGGVGDVRHAVFEEVTGRVFEGSGGTLAVRDAAVVRSAYSMAAPCVFVHGDGHAELERVAFTDHRSDLVNALSASVRLTDVVFEAPDDAVGLPEQTVVGVLNAGLELERTRLHRPRVGAVAAVDATSAALTDVVLRDVRDGGEPLGGHGVEVLTGSTLRAERFVVEGARGLGLLADGVGTTVDLLDTRIGRVATDTSDFGRGLQAQRGAVVDATRLHVHDTAEAGVISATSGTRVQLEDATVAAVAGVGVGMGAYVGASLGATRFLTTDNALAGAQVARDGELDLADGVVARNVVGVNVQIVGYDYDRLTVGVFYVDNEVSLDATDLPVPPVSTP